MARNRAVHYLQKLGMTRSPEPEATRRLSDAQLGGLLRSNEDLPDNFFTDPDVAERVLKVMEARELRRGL